VTGLEEIELVSVEPVLIGHNDQKGQVQTRDDPYPGRESEQLSVTSAGPTGGRQVFAVS